MKLKRLFSLYSNKLYIEAVNKIQNSHITDAIPLLEQLKTDPTCYTDLKNYTRVNEYLKGCYIATRDFRNLSSVLEQLIFLNMEKPFEESSYLQLLKDLVRSYIDGGLYEKALFLVENYQNILKKKYYTDNFTNEMDLIKSTVYLLFDRYSESEKVSMGLMDKEINNTMTGISLNNLAIVSLLSKTQNSDETISRLKQALYQFELAKHTKLIDVPIIQNDTSKTTKSMEIMSEERLIQIDKENIQSKGNLRDARRYQQQAGYKLLEKLDNIMKNKKPKLNDLYGYKIMNPYSLNVMGNLGDVYKTSEDFNNALIWNKYGLDTTQRYNISLYPRFAYSIYSIYKKLNNINMAENFLIAVMSMAKIIKSPYEQLAYCKYADILWEEQRYYELYSFSKAYAGKFCNSGNKHTNYDTNMYNDIKVEDLVNPLAMRANYLVFEDYNTKIN